MMHREYQGAARRIRRVILMNATALTASTCLTQPGWAQALATSASTSAAVVASTDGSPDSSGLTDIVVTASKRTESIQKTPIAVTAISADGIQQQRITTFRDLSGRVPGLLAPKRSTAYTTQTYSIRGVGEVDTYPEPTVAVYVDDVYLARTVGSLYDTPDLERVEVLRGPQGTLYGRNSSAGAIRFITKEPTADRELFVSAAYGSFNNLDLQARINGAILPDDKLNGAFSVIRHTRDGWQYSVPLNRKVNDLDLTIIRGKLKSEVTDKLTITLSGDAMFDRSSQSYYTPVNQPNGVPSGRKTDPDITYADTLPYNHTNAYGGSLTVKYDIDDHLTLKSVTAYRGFDGPIYYDNDGVLAIKGDSYAGFKQYQETQEFNLNGEYGRFNFVAGLYYFYENFFNNRLNQATAGAVDNIGSVSRIVNTLRTRSYSAFGQANVKLTDKLTFTAGGRFTTDQRKYHSVVGNSTNVALHAPQEWGYNPDNFAVLYGPYQVNFVANPDPKRFSNFTPKLGAQYQWTPDIFQYASWSQGFKSGSFDLRSASLAGSTIPFKPQIVTTYETGVKTKFFDNRLSANLSIFYNDIKDLQVRATAPATLTTPAFSGILNAGKGQSKGAELEVSIAPFEGFRLDASGAYLQTKYKTFTAVLPANVAGRTTLLGLDFPLSPKWQSSFAATYVLPFKTAGQWKVALDGQYESARFVDIYNTAQTKVRKQIFFNGNIGYTGEDKSWSTGVNVKNIFDLRRGQAGGYALNAGSQVNYYRAYNEPRTVNIYVSKTF
jgi:iron complex outermembrane receptor protein